MMRAQNILNKLLDLYENRGYYRGLPKEKPRIISVYPERLFPEYKNHYNHEEYLKVNASIELLMGKGFVDAKKTAAGEYSSVSLRLDAIEAAYLFLHRKSLGIIHEEISHVVTAYRKYPEPVLQKFLDAVSECVTKGINLPHGINRDVRRLKEVLDCLLSVLSISKETYIRNFSIALYKDSKEFQRKYLSVIQSILFEYTDAEVEKRRILEMYNLYENPTYVLFKGFATVFFRDNPLILDNVPGGISVPETALCAITHISVSASRVITVENLTSYHDCNEPDAFIVYLGGYHNRSKQLLLQMVYRQNPNCKYLHYGDLDVFGFSILESLKERTGIPFIPYHMDVDTLEQYRLSGFVSPLSVADRKKMEDPRLSSYESVFQYMRHYNCKAEQEAETAVTLSDALGTDM